MTSIAYYADEDYRNEHQDYFRKYVNPRTQLNFTNLNSGNVSIEVNGASGFVAQFPANCSWLVVKNISFQRMDVGRFASAENLFKIVEKMGKDLDYSHVFCSINENQEMSGWGKCLEAAGYTLLHENENRHTDRQVYLYIRKINYGEE